MKHDCIYYNDCECKSDSVCCGMPMDGDICSACGEHTDDSCEGCQDYITDHDMKCQEGDNKVKSDKEDK